MALKNKDGSTYTLAKPNPIMKHQSLWANEKYLLHNMKWKVEVFVDENDSNAIEENQVESSFIEELKQTKPELEKITENIFEQKTVVQTDTKKEEEKKSEINKIFVHCLPATIKIKTDDLYGDSYQTIQYGSPTSFEAVMLKQDDLSCEIWTDTDTIAIGSVIFPKINTKRWWRIKNKEKKANGWILYSITSDFQPSFDV
jgi:hypothetical protein